MLCRCIVFHPWRISTKVGIRTSCIGQSSIYSHKYVSHLNTTCRFSMCTQWQGLTLDAGALHGVQSTDVEWFAGRADSFVVNSVFCAGDVAAGNTSCGKTGMGGQH